MSSDGSSRWSLANVSSGFSLGDDGTAYAVVAGNPSGLGCNFYTSVVAAVSADDGTRHWGVTLPCNQIVGATASPLIVGADGTVYLGSQAQDLVTGLSAQTLAISAAGTVRWSRDEASSPLMVGADGTVYFSGSPGTRAYGRDGALRWQTDLAGHMAALPNGDVLVLDYGGSLHDLRANGGVAWSFDLASAGLSTAAGPVVVEDAIYLTSVCVLGTHCTPRMIALSLDGVPLWTLEGVTSSGWIAVGEDAVYVLEAELQTAALTLVAISD